MRMFQDILEVLPKEERDFIGELDLTKDIIEFGNKDTCMALLTKGMKTKIGKQAYWLIIATHPVCRGNGLASKLLEEEVLPYIQKNDGVLYSKIKPSNHTSKQWHIKHRAAYLTTNVEGWEIWTIPCV